MQKFHKEIIYAATRYTIFTSWSCMQPSGPKITLHFHVCTYFCASALITCTITLHNYYMFESVHDGDHNGVV